MKIIGITGGIGAGKSQVLSYIEKNCSCRILIADGAAHAVEEPGQPCYDRLTALLGKEVLTGDGHIDKKKMAAVIFPDETLLKQVNAIIHPAVKEYILSEIDKEKHAGNKDAFFLEAALLIEEGYGRIADELWYIYAPENVRRERLKAFRGYSDEKISHIFKSQLTEAQFRAHCKVVIDNGKGLSDTYMQIHEILKRTGLLK